MTSVVIASAARTPVGSFNGAFANVPAHELGAAAIRAALERAGVDAAEVDEVIMGQILTAGEGQNPARQASMGAGCPQETTAWNLNQLCGSGLRTVAIGMQQILTGDAKVIVAGGQESMSLAPHCAHLRGGVKMGDWKLVDTMLKDALMDAFNGYHMGNTAENVAAKWQITREQQDAFAAASQEKAGKAMKAGRFKDEIVPVTIKTRRGETVVDTDEHPKPETTVEALAKLRAAFSKDGTVTAGNASGINDGAAALLVASEEAAKNNGLTLRARIVAMAVAGVAPRIMGFAPAPAIRKLLAKTGMSLDQIDVIELNEAFAAQALAVSRELGLDPAKVNPRGGAIALGHPIGASGARILTTLIHTLRARGGGRGVAALCIGGGMGIAMVVES